MANDHDGEQQQQEQNAVAITFANKIHVAEHTERVISSSLHRAEY